MATTYPSCISDSEICNFCYASQTCVNCVDGSGNHPCSAYCNTGCNTKCDVAQTFCYNGVLTVIDHADVPDFMTGCWVKDEFIFRNWRAADWNKVLDQLKDAAALGLVENQGTIPAQIKVTADPENAPHPAGSLVTAAAYNSMVDSINFFNQSLAHVNVGDVIRGAHALALETGYNSMTFNDSVCDVCNAGNENRNMCNCDCDCACTCSCDCTCACSCSGCDCSCSNSGE